MFDDPQAAVDYLRTPHAIRERCGLIFAAAKQDRLAHFALDRSRLNDAARYVAATIRDNYPTLAIPDHSRWRHFAAGGTDRWVALAERIPEVPGDEIARIRVELAAISVLLDAGAGERWRYREPGSNASYARSEGLAVASFHLYAQGIFSALSDAPLRVDADALLNLDAQRLAAGFQAAPDNPLVGLEARIELLRRLGAALYAQPALFGRGSPRLGQLYDFLAATTQGGCLPAAAILAAVLRGLEPIWPRRRAIGGVNLGDVGYHSLIRTGDLTAGLVPFHKLSQWLTYSLIEPLEQAGIRVTELDALTGLPEYRNGGLLIDLGVLCPRHTAVLGEAHAVDAEPVVEWRALTVILLDLLAERVRTLLGTDKLPLTKILEGGTWQAGRRIAYERRPDGAPPLRLLSDGTVF